MTDSESTTEIITGNIGGDFVGRDKTETKWFSPTKTTVNIYESKDSYKRGQEETARKLDAEIIKLERRLTEAVKNVSHASGRAEVLQEQLTELKSAKADVERTLSDIQASYAVALAKIDELKAQIAELGNSVPKELIAEIEAALQAGDLDRADELITPLLTRKPVEDMIAEQARLYHLAGEIAAERYDYAEARVRYVRAVGLLPENFNYQIDASDMANKAGAYHQAEHYAREALALVQDDPDRELDQARAQNALADALVSQGLYDKAQPLYERALENRERVLGAEHPDTLTSVNNLGFLYQAQGRYDQAEPLYERALESRERVLGAEHPSTLISVNNLGFLYRAQGCYAKAEPLYERALESRERVLGADHPDTLISVNSLGYLYRAQGLYDLAERFYVRALEVRKRVLGVDHPRTLISMNNLGYLYRQQGRYDQAEPLYERVLEIRERVLGAEHPSTLISVNNLGYLYLTQGRYDQAERLLERALESRVRVLGAEHPDTLNSVNNLAVLYENQGFYAKAEPLYDRAACVGVTRYGPDIPMIRTFAANYLNLLEKTDQQQKAQDFIKQYFNGKDPRT